MKFEVKSNFRALGTDINIRIVCNNETEKEKAKRDLKKAKDIFFSKQKIFSRFDNKSELCQLNRNLGIWQKISPDMAFLAKRALFYHRESGGLYDPRIIDVLENIGYKSKNIENKDSKPVKSKQKNLSADLKIRLDKIFLVRRIDFSGIAKGYIVDCATQYLKYQGWKNFLVNANGDAYAAGRNAKGEKWKLPVEGARDKSAAVHISNQAVATSGVIKKQWRHKGKNVHHLVNPQDPGKFSFEVHSVLVFHKKTELADGRAKVLVLMGMKKGLVNAKKKKLNAIFVDNKGEIKRVNTHENLRQSNPASGEKRSPENFRRRI